jgi:hypothetical protein
MKRRGGAGTSAYGLGGLVPPAPASPSGKFLNASGQWAAPSGGSGYTNHTDLNFRGWNVSGHTGTALALAAFASTTAATYAIIGTHVQAYDAGLASLASLPTVADRVAYSTGADVWAETPLTSFMRTLLDDADAATARATLGVPALRPASLLMMRMWAPGPGGTGTGVGFNSTNQSSAGTLAGVYVTGSAHYYQSITTTTTIGNEGGFEASAVTVGMHTSSDHTFYCAVRTPADRTNSRIFIGFAVNQVANVDTIGNDSLLWRLSPGDTKWTLIGKDTGAQEEEPTGPNVANSTEYLLRVRYDQSAAKAYGAVSTDNGATWSAETEVTTIPTAGLNMPPLVRVVNVAGGTTATMQWAALQLFATLDDA